MLFLERHKKNIERFLFSCIAVALVTYAFYPIVNGIGTWADPLRGFSILKSMGNGTEFNMLSFPDPDNIANDKSFFVAWWSPGQYLVPFAFTLLGLDINTAQTTTVILCALIGLSGFYRLYLFCGFDKTTVLFSLFLIVLNRNFFWHFIIYFGGETLLFSIVPWAIYFPLKHNSLSPAFILFFIGFSIVGFIFKSSYLLIFLAILFALFLIKIDKEKSVLNKTILIHATKLFFVFTAILLMIYFGYLSKGETPGSAIDTGMTYNIPNTLAGDFIYPLAHLSTVFFRVGDALHKLLPLFTKHNIDIAWIFTPFALLTFLLIFIIVKKSPDRKYSLVIIALGFTYWLFFTVAYFKNAAISYESRHYVLFGYLFIPGFLHAAKMYGYKGFISLVLILTAFAFLDYGRFHKKTNDFYSTYFYTNNFYCPMEDEEEITLIRRLDDSLSTGNNIFIFDKWELSTVVNNNRTLCVVFAAKGMHAVATGIELDYPPTFGCLQGKADNIVLVLKKNGYATSLPENGFCLKNQYVFLPIYETANYRISISQQEKSK